jgi:hypothetical protein
MKEDRFKVIHLSWRFLFISIFVLAFLFLISCKNAEGEASFTDETEMPKEWRDIDIKK